MFLNDCFSEAWKEFEWRLEEPGLKIKLEKLPGTLVQNHNLHEQIHRLYPTDTSNQH